VKRGEVPLNDEGFPQQPPKRIEESDGDYEILEDNIRTTSTSSDESKSNSKLE